MRRSDCAGAPFRADAARPRGTRYRTMSKDACPAHSGGGSPRRHTRGGCFSADASGLGAEDRASYSAQYLRGSPSLPPSRHRWPRWTGSASRPPLRSDILRVRIGGAFDPSWWTAGAASALRLFVSLRDRGAGLSRGLRAFAPAPSRAAPWLPSASGAPSVYPLRQPSEAASPTSRRRTPAGFAAPVAPPTLMMGGGLSGPRPVDRPAI